MANATYEPSSSEKKTVVLIYLLIGSMMILHKDRISSWVWNHLHQALWRWICFVIIAMVSLLLVFIPLLSLVPLFALVISIGLWWWFVYQARNGTPAYAEWGLSVFAHVGKWMTDLIDIHPTIEQEDTGDVTTSPTEIE